MIYTFARANVNVSGKRTENMMPAHSFFVPCSSIAACLEQNYDRPVGSSDRVFYLNGVWKVAPIGEDVQSIETDDVRFMTVVTPYTQQAKQGEKLCVVMTRTFNVFDVRKTHLVSFEKVNGFFEVYCNGHFCGSSELGFGEFDLSQYVEKGDNELLLRVLPFDGSDGIGLEGDVLLSLKTAASLFDYDFRFSTDGFSQEGILRMEVRGEDTSVSVVFGDDDDIIDEPVAIPEEGIATVKLKGLFNVYTSETPYLYDAYIRIFQNGTEVECTHIKFGFSSVAVRENRFTAGNTPFKIKAVAYDEADGKLKADYKDELNIIKNFNFNTVLVRGIKERGFYKLCSEMGLYVINEFALDLSQKQEADKKKKKPESSSNDVFDYYDMITKNVYASIKNEPCILAYSFKSVENEEYWTKGVEPFAVLCGKPVEDIDFTIAEDGTIACIGAEFVRLDELTSAFNKNNAGVLIDGFKDCEGKIGLFDEGNLAKETAVIAKYVFRPYESALADNRTIVLKNNNVFASSQGLLVKISAVRGSKENDVTVFHPVLKAGEEQNYSFYVGEYDERTKLHVQYVVGNVHVATETLHMKEEVIRPEALNELKTRKYEYSVVNKEFDLTKLEENTMKKRCYFIPFSSEDLAKKGKVFEAAEQSDRVYTISGEWDFLYYKANAPVTFGGDKAQWETIVLPCSWESVGKEEFRYEDGYPFKANLKKFSVEEEKDFKNSVGIYRKVINVGDTSFRYVLYFAQVNGSLELQINGKYVGFTQLGTAEFDVTDYLTIGENEIVLIVKRWTPVSYLFGKPGFAESGIIGDIRLVKYRKGGLEDYSLSLKRISGDFLLDAELSFFGEGNGQCKVEMKRGNESIYERVHEIENGKAHVKIQGDFDLYNEFSATTYDIYVKVLENGFVTECTRIPIGFNSVSIVGDTVYYNDDPIKLRGIVYNPVYNGFGTPISYDDVKRDLALIKEYGFNAVRPICRTSPEFVQIAMQYGLYVICGGEISTEAAGLKKEKERNAVMANAEFAKAAKEIIATYAKRNAFACNVFAYLMDEDATTVCGEGAYKALKEITTRPVMAKGKSDILLAKFPAIIEVVDMVNENAGKTPIFFSEYASGSGVGCATMHEYDELMRGAPCCLGGCVANFTDDVIGGVGKKSNGIFTATRYPYPSADSIRYLYRPLVSELAVNGSTIEITNRTGATVKDKYISLNILINGTIASKTRLDVNLPPYATKKYDVFIGHVDEDMFLNVVYLSKKDDRVLYAEQHRLHEQMQEFKLKAGRNPVTVTEMFDYIDVAFDNGFARFNKRTGGLVRYLLSGVDILKPDSIHRGGNSFSTNIYRPFVRNMHGKSYEIKPKSFALDEQGDGYSVRLLIDNFLLSEGKEIYIVSDRYTVHANGVIQVSSAIMPIKKTLPVMDCFGKQLRLDNMFGKVTYYGNGETDNYIDMCEHTTIGVFSLNVDKTFEKYPVIQECGNRTDVRYTIVRNNDGEGIIIAAKNVPYQLRVSPYSDKEIVKGYKTGEKPKQSGVYIDINAFVSGIGTSENGYPLPKYVVPSGQHVVMFDIIPVAALSSRA